MGNKRTEYSKKWSDNNLKEGKCSCCNNYRLPNSKRYCEKHYLFVKSKTHFKTTKLWEELLSLLYSQDIKCALTGEIIILSVNDSLDHIVPPSKFTGVDPNDFSNLRWVTRQVNTVKNDLTDEELIKLLEKIKNHLYKT